MRLNPPLLIGGSKSEYPVFLNRSFNTKPLPLLFGGAVLFLLLFPKSGVGGSRIPNKLPVDKRNKKRYAFLRYPDENGGKRWEKILHFI